MRAVRPSSTITDSSNGNYEVSYQLESPVGAYSLHVQHIASAGGLFASYYADASFTRVVSARTDATLDWYTPHAPTLHPARSQDTGWESWFQKASSLTPSPTPRARTQRGASPSPPRSLPTPNTISLTRSQEIGGKPAFSLPDDAPYSARWSPS